jgi:hypothetical protein
MRLLLCVLAIIPVLAAGNCEPEPTPPDTGNPGNTCSLSCPFGKKTDITGVAYCECRAEEECVQERPAPFVNPATGECTGFPTDCDIPTGWAVCPQCAVNECGPSPGVPDRICSDDTRAGATCSRHEDGDCSWTILGCPEDGDVCNQTLCPAGWGCCNWSCSQCAPPDGACTQQVCEAGF